MLSAYNGVIYMGEQNTGYPECSSSGDHFYEAEGREEPVLAEHGQGHCHQAHVLHPM